MEHPRDQQSEVMVLLLPLNVTNHAKGYNNIHQLYEGHHIRGK